MVSVLDRWSGGLSVVLGPWARLARYSLAVLAELAVLTGLID